MPTRWRSPSSSSPSASSATCRAACFTRSEDAHEMPSPDRSLSVIIPAYNEAENIMATLENVAAAFETLAIPHEILVIDDGSKDDTAAIVERARGRYPAVRLLKNEKNMGFGWSYRRGVDEAALAHI